MTTKADKLTSNIDELLKLVPGGSDDGTKKQEKIEYLKETNPALSSYVALYEKRRNTYYSATVNDLLNLLSQGVGHGQLFLSSVPISYPLNSSFRLDMDRDGLADNWNVITSADLSRSDIKATINDNNNPDVFIKGQIIRTTKLGDSENSYFGLSQTFERYFSETEFDLLVRCYNLGSGSNPVNVRISSGLLQTGAFVELVNKPFTPKKNEIVKLLVNNLPKTAKFIKIDIYIKGPAEKDANYAFMIMEPKILVGIQKDQMDGSGIDILDDKSNIFHGVKSITFSDFSLKNITGSHVEISNPSLKIGTSVNNLNSVHTQSIIFPTSIVNLSNEFDNSSPLQVTPLINLTNASTGKETKTQKIVINDGIDLSEDSDGVAHLSSKSIIKWIMGEGPDVPPGKAETLSFSQGLTAQPNPRDPKTVDIKLVDNIFNALNITQWLSVTQNPLNITSEPKAIWFGDSMLDVPGNIVGDSRAKILYINPIPGKSSQFLVVFKVNFFGLAQEDGFIRIFVKEHDISGKNEDFLYDIHNTPIAVQKNYKQGDIFDGLLVAGVIDFNSNFGLKFYIEHNFKQWIRLDTYVDNPSAILVQTVGVNTPALYEFEGLTDYKIKMYTHRYNNPVANLADVLSNNLEEKTYSALNVENPNSFFAEGGFNLAPVKDVVDMYINNNIMYIKSSPLVQKRSYCYFVYTFYPDDTEMLKGKNLTGEIIIDECDRGGAVCFVSWNGAGDLRNADDIYTEIVNAKYILGSGWTENKVVDIPITKQETKISLSAQVPYNARACAMLLRIDSKKTWNCNIKNFVINVKNQFTGAILKYVKPAGEIIPSLSTKFARYIQDNQNFRSLRYTINKTPSACPLGMKNEKSNPVPLILDPTANMVPGSAAKGGEGVFKFTQDVSNLQINTTVRLYAGEKLADDETGVVSFSWHNVENDGSIAEDPLFPEAVTDVYKNQPPLEYYFSITGNFAQGQRIALRMHSNGQDYAFLQASSPHLPLIENVISVKEF